MEGSQRPEREEERHTCYAEIVDPVLVLDYGWRDSGRVFSPVVLRNMVKQISISKIDGFMCEIRPYAMLAISPYEKQAVTGSLHS